MLLLNKVINNKYHQLCTVIILIRVFLLNYKFYLVKCINSLRHFTDAYIYIIQKADLITHIFILFYFAFFFNLMLIDLH